MDEVVCFGRMFGLGMGELILIAVVALLALGPDRLPSAAKKIGQTIRDLRRQTGELKKTIEADAQLGDAVKEIRSALNDDPFRNPLAKKKPEPPPKPPKPSLEAASDAEPEAGDESEAETAGEPAVEPAEGAVARDAGEEPEAGAPEPGAPDPAAEPQAAAGAPTDPEPPPKTEPIMINMSEYQRYVHMWGPEAAAEKYGTTLEEAEAAISAVVGTVERESSDG